MKETIVGVKKAYEQAKNKENHKYDLTKHDIRKLNGLCTLCGKRKPSNGILTCIICTKKRVAYYKNGGKNDPNKA